MKTAVKKPEKVTVKKTVKEKNDKAGPMTMDNIHSTSQEEEHEEATEGASEKPSKGSTVYYVPVEGTPEASAVGEKVSAVVTKVTDDGINLEFYAGTLEEPSSASNVKYSADKEQGTWHYPAD